MLGVGHHHVGRQPIVRRAHLARGATGARLAGEAQGIQSWPADLAGDEVQVGDEVVHPRAAHVLVDAHAPQTHGAARQVPVDAGQRRDLFHRHAGDVAHALRRVVGEEGAQLVEAARPRHVFERVTFGLLVEAAVADGLHVFNAAAEHHVLVDERLLDASRGHEQVQDPVGERQVGAGL